MTEPKKSGNGPTEAQIREAFDQIVGHFEELATERGAYMARCKSIRERMNAVYDTAADRGITRKVLKAKVKEHDTQQKLLAIRDALEDDDRSEFDKLTEVLGDFGSTALGTHALDAAKRKDGQGTLDELTRGPG